jgi:hypothetical protein
MAENALKASETTSIPKNGPLGSRRKPDLPPGRPPTPTVDARVEASKTWSPAARAAARKAFTKATSSGASREEAIEAGYRAGLRREEKKPPPLPELAAYATSLLGARVVDVISPRRKIDPVEERCFERLFPDKGFPDRPAVVAVPQTPKSGRSESAPEDQKTTHEKALPGDPSPRQTGLGLE